MLVLFHHAQIKVWYFIFFKPCHLKPKRGVSSRPFICESRRIGQMIRHGLWEGQLTYLIYINFLQYLETKNLSNLYRHLGGFGDMFPPNYLRTKHWGTSILWAIWIEEGNSISSIKMKQQDNSVLGSQNIQNQNSSYSNPTLMYCTNGIKACPLLK